jgi:hypothetical protein
VCVCVYMYIHEVIRLKRKLIPDTTCRARQCTGPGNFHLSSASCVQGLATGFRIQRARVRCVERHGESEGGRASSGV